MKLLRERGEGFSEIYSLMIESFPPDELRSESGARAIVSNSAYRLYRITERGRFLGFISVWRLSEFAFIEHFAILPEMRGKGYGARAISALGRWYKDMVLEAEPPECEISKRRIAFYERCGFHLSMEEYYQPPYKKGASPVRLMLMRYPAPIENHEKVAAALYREVYKRK